MAAFQKQGSGLQSGPGKRCSTDSPDSSSLLGRKEVASRKQGRMFLSSIHMTSAQRQMSEVHRVQTGAARVKGTPEWKRRDSAALPFADSLLSMWSLQGQMRRTAGPPVQVRTLRRHSN